MNRRIVVTGLGLVTPLGVGVPLVWQRLIEGRSGLRRLDDRIISDVASKVAGLVPNCDEEPQGGFDLAAVIPLKDRKKLDRFIQFGLAAADEAIKQSSWRPSSDDERERTATIMASGIGGFHAITAAVLDTEHKGVRRLSPFTVPSFIVNLAGSWISIRHGFKGPLGAPTTACAAGIQAIGDGARMIRAGEIDIAICGGAEACINRVSLGSFAAARALSTAYNDRPKEASRPFDDGRDGFVMGEGAGVLVIESLEHARARGAMPIAELVGYGTSADAFHLTGSPDDGNGAQRAMRTALRQAAVDPAIVGYLNAHATSTPVGDRGELAAVRAVFGKGGQLAISSTKSATGHLLGAAGGLAAVFTVLALRDGILPPTLNLVNPDLLANGLDLVADSGRHTPIDYAMANGFGFGGVNASILFKRWNEPPSTLSHIGV